MDFQPGNQSAQWFYNGYFLLPKIYNGYFLLPKTASEMHVALRIVAAKWSPSGVPVVTKYTQHTSARAKTGAKRKERLTTYGK